MTTSGTSTTASPSPSAEEGPLRRAIGPKLLILFVIGDILGTGIYATTGKVAGKVGGALWLPFAIGFVVAILTAASYVELVGKYPKAAGAALYTQKAFKVPFLTFIIAFMVMCSGLSSASAAARAFSGDYLAELTGDALPPTLIAITFIVLLAALNMRGVSESVKTNVVLTLVELTGLAIILAIGAYAVMSGDGEASRLTEFESDGSGYALMTGVLGATALGFFAFVGFEDSVNMAEETKDPVRTFPRAIFIGVAVTGTIYVLVAMVSSLLVDSRTLEGSSGPLLEVVKAGGVDFPHKLFALIALFAVTNSALINIMMASRLCYGMANERILPRAMGRVLSGRRTPVVGIVFVSLLAIGLVSTGEIEGLGDTTAFLLLCVFAVVNVAVLVLRRDPVGHKHFRTPTVLPVLGAVTALVLASPLADRPAEVYIRAGVLVAIGVALWGVNKVVLRARGED
ncbi:MULTISPECIES: APC family permease [Streptomyces]|uniref:Amino acid permease n=1 Tax=Streptomyces venezuelae TaxID=54571 RepID=A0A5P2BCF8_STRVZ|nr:APC family permease [Streptomyces venezuelae]MYY81653.1 amino acid permease [Streptomyces sp. SID335]MYZ18282.1 amino acid permease [Streptomyces sp. SID337]NDZ91945.1 APC family permease [Streptomyces sp. SID10115]NEA04127.1 APC family permease [Streptomyces sp. SID10116]NEB43701.1 APC family permease [Streptomyces sp. SID339]